MLVDARALLAHAVAHRYAVGAYDLLDTLMLEAIVAGAEAARAPLILSVAESHLSHFALEPLMAAVVRAAEITPLPVAIHYDHGGTLEALTRATRFGFTSLMLDASHASYAENVALTRQAAQLAHSVGLPLEAELGYVPGVEGEDAANHPGALRFTDPEEAASFVAETGCDWLAVSIGTVHGRLRERVELDIERLAAIRERLPATPLVIHGGTGLSDEQMRSLVAAGANKINYYTALVEQAGAAACAERRWDAQRRAAFEAIRSEVERTARLWGAAGRAEEVAAAAPRLKRVEHVIIHRWSGTHEELAAMRALGQAQLGSMPGVLRVVAGDSIASDRPYPFLWSMTFATPAALERFQRDAAHQTFADAHFRPFAAQRITTDFLFEA